MSKLIMTSPQGRAGWTSLDRANTHFDPEGVYETVLYFDPRLKEVKVFLNELERHFKVFLKETKEKGIKVRRGWELMKDEESGEIGVKFKQKQKEWMEGKNPIAFFDSLGNAIKDKIPMVGSGSVLSVTAELVFSVVSSKAYLTMRIKAVQILQLQTFSAEERTAEEYGFQVTEGGYAATADGNAMNDEEGDEEMEDEEIDDYLDDDEEAA